MSELFNDEAQAVLVHGTKTMEMKAVVGVDSEIPLRNTSLTCVLKLTLMAGPLFHCLT